MLKFLFKQKVIETIVDKVVTEVSAKLERHESNQNKNFDTVIEHLEKLRFELSSLDQRLTQKELKDRVDYGQMQYKISAIQNDLRDQKKKKKDLQKSH
ncbi:MAG: hypothetical protein QF441_00415 [Bacteriovoracaceae bacterium]|jgi:predicted RNase H-like nuclease (RuvC/YqgF family)|nr:hypothetical protein [Bacteriovoracaceae bacterium]|tara:strand:+ start:219 stop:512 length:294 start_codon:yes stop_codon:yes gene_type:complete